MSKIMLINVLQPEECRIAILENGVLEELYVERTSHESYVANIYKGRIVNIEPSIQAAFVDFGVGRNGFLHVSDVEPTYYRHLEQRRDAGRQGGGRGGRDRDRGDRGGRREEGRSGGDRDRRPPREQPPRRPVEEEADRGRVEREPARADPEVARPWGGLDDLEPEPAEFTAGASLEEDVTVAELPPAVAPAREAIPPVQAVPTEEASPVSESASSAEVAAPRERPGHAVEEVGGAAEAVPPVAETPKKTTRRRKDESTPRRTPVRKRKPKAGAEGGEATADTPPAEGASEEPPKPKLMDSAERRTDEEDSGSGESSSGDEDLIFFPRSQPAGGSWGGAAEPQRLPEPAPEAPRPVARDTFTPPPERAFEEPRESPPPPPPRPSREQSSDRGERGRGGDRGRGGRDDRGSRGGRGDRSGRGDRGDRGRRGGSIEDALEEDLRAAEVGREVADPVSFDAEPAPREIVEAPAEEEEAVPVWGEDEDEDAGMGEFYEDFDFPGGEERAPEEPGRREGRGGREGNREGGRGGPRGRGDRRGRDRRPGGGGGGGRDHGSRPKPLIQDIFRRGQEVIVQVIKDGLGTKGPTLSTYISIAGRYLVLMPGLNRVGVSRKIGDEEQRRRLRDIFNDLKPPKGLGFIIRTAGEDKNKKELQRDLAYLSRLWQVVARRIRRNKTPSEIYQESDMITRTIRDTFTADIDAIIVDEPAAFEHAQEFLQIVMPRFADRIQKYEGTEPLFHKYGIEAEMDRIQQRKVPLPAGGSIVIEQTEALVAIDVNSGNFRAADHNAEETAYQINLQAAKEIARQLRLRDLGGVIVNDFIDMRDEKHRRGVEKALHDAVKRDRARTKVLKISAFGIIEMTRQRIRPSLKRSVYQECPGCGGTGHVKTAESMSIEVMRLLQLAAHRDYIRRVEARVTEAVANYLQNRKRKEINQMEETGGMQVQITGLLGAPPETLEFFCLDNNNNEVKLFPTDDRRPPRR